METGLRGGDAVVLPFDPIVDDSVGWPCLRFVNAKIGVEQLLPLRAPGRHHHRSPTSPRPPPLPPRITVAVPRHRRQPRRTKPYPHRLLLPQLGKWQAKIGVHDEAGQPSVSTPTSSVTPSAPGSSTPASPNTSSRSCSATPAPR